jgi:hypothetical protein
MKSLCFRIPAELHADLMRAESPEIDRLLDMLEKSVRRSVARMLLREQRRDDRLTA